MIKDGGAVLSSLILAVDAAEKEILTIEGMGREGNLHPLQQAFMEKGGLQCGFCTPGMILTAKTILDEEMNPTEADVRRKMAGNLCRCTGYKKILDAVMSVADSRGKEG